MVCFDDEFDAALDVESVAVAEGYASGEREGLAAGLHEGRRDGFGGGVVLGAELGSYYGAVAAWRAAGHMAVPRLRTAIEALERELADVGIPRADDRVLEKALEAVRAKYRRVAAQIDGHDAEGALPASAPSLAF